MRKSKSLPSLHRFSKRRKTWSFHVVVWKRMAMKCTKIYNGRALAQLLFCSLNLLFGVAVAVAIVVCLGSLLSFLRGKTYLNISEVNRKILKL